MSSDTGESSGIKVMTRKQLFNIMQGCKGEKITEKLEYLENYYLLNRNRYSEKERVAFKHSISHLKSELKRRWVSAKYRKYLFDKQNLNWLQGTFEIPTTSSQAGRLPKSFTELSEQSKRRKTEDIRKMISTEELTFAAQAKLRSSGQVDASIVLQEVTKC